MNKTELIAIVAENAKTGACTSQAAVPVYNYYFSQKTQFDVQETPNTLIP